MDKKTYNIIAASVTGVVGVVAAVVAKLNPAYEAAIEASLPIFEGAVLAICGNFVINEEVKHGIEQ